MEKDTELVTKLASTVLERSDEINERVSSLPGMQRTREQQMEYIEKLLEQNQEAAQDLEEQYAIAKERRDQVRTFIRDNTCEALGIQEGELI
jgi:dsDNA-specific endonuclease/ATPase MutS2